MGTHRKVKDMDTKESRQGKVDIIGLAGEHLDLDKLDCINEIDGSTPILVRCYMGSFVCSASDAKHFIMIIDHSTTDWVKDVSLHLHSYSIQEDR